MLGEDYEVLETYKGKDLEFKEYEPLYDCSVPLCEKQHKKAYYVVCADYVTLTDGTNINTMVQTAVITWLMLC